MSVEVRCDCLFCKCERAEMKEQPKGKPSRAFCGAGGRPVNEKSFGDESLRADLYGIANNISFPHGTKIIDAILKDYEVSRRP